MHKLTFADLLSDSKNMWMRGCFFADGGKSVFSLATQNKRKSFLIKWKSSKGSFSDKDGECQSVNVAEVHNNTCTGLRLSEDNSQLAISTSDGFIKVA